MWGRCRGVGGRPQEARLGGEGKWRGAFGSLPSEQEALQRRSEELKVRVQYLEMIDMSLRAERAAVHMDCKSFNSSPALDGIR